MTTESVHLMMKEEMYNFSLLMVLIEWARALLLTPAVIKHVNAEMFIDQGVDNATQVCWERLPVG